MGGIGCVAGSSEVEGKSENGYGWFAVWVDLVAMIALQFLLVVLNSDRI